MKWARKFDACTTCGTTQNKHKGRGLCNTCWNREWQAIPGNREKYLQCLKAYNFNNGDKRAALSRDWRAKNRDRHNELNRISRAKFKEATGVFPYARFRPGDSKKHPVAGWVEILAPAFRRGKCSWFVLVKNRHGESIELPTSEFSSGATYRKGEQPSATHSVRDL